MAKEKTPKIYDPQHRKWLEATQLAKRNTQIERRRKRKDAIKQATINADKAEYSRVLKEINRLQDFLNSTPNNADDGFVIEAYKKLLYKKYILEQTGNIPCELADKNSCPQRFLPSVNVVVDVEWLDVIFSEGKLTFRYNENFYDIVIADAKEAYNQLIPIFAQRLPVIRIEIKHSTANIINEIDFTYVIDLLKWCQTVFHIEDGKRGCVKISSLNKIPTKLIRQFFHYDKTEYLNYLQEKQYGDAQIIPLFENLTQNPDGFLFTIDKGNECWVVWESCKDMINKATYVFQAPLNQLHNLQQLIFDYTYSSIPNKRRNLRTNKVKEFWGFNYRSVDHDNFPSWVNHLENSFKEKKHSKQKNEKDVTYHINQERTYIPIHNIVQNKLKSYLENLSCYKEVLLESDNVDIKAITQDGEWHYFELKTSAPRLCIREALGQILEYAHYPFDNRAKKLYIIGCYALSENEIKYMKLLREIYNMPIWYRWFDYNTNQLSSEF